MTRKRFLGSACAASAAVCLLFCRTADAQLAKGNLFLGKTGSIRLADGRSFEAERLIAFKPNKYIFYSENGKRKGKRYRDVQTIETHLGIFTYNKSTLLFDIQPSPTLLAIWNEQQMRRAQLRAYQQQRIAAQRSNRQSYSGYGADQIRAASDSLKIFAGLALLGVGNALKNNSNQNASNFSFPSPPAQKNRRITVQMTYSDGTKPSNAFAPSVHVLDWAGVSTKIFHPRQRYGLFAVDVPERARRMRVRWNDVSVTLDISRRNAFSATFGKKPLLFR